MTESTKELGGLPKTVLKPNVDAVIPERVQSSTTKTGLTAPPQDHVQTPLIGSIDKTDRNAYTPPKKIGQGETFARNFAPIAMEWWNAAEESYKFEPDPSFTGQSEMVAEFFKNYGIHNEEEVTNLNTKAVSAEHLSHKFVRVLGKRRADSGAAEHTWTALSAGLIDADLALAPLGGGAITAGTKVGRFGQRAAMTVAFGGGASIINDRIADTTLRPWDEYKWDAVTFGLVGLFSTTRGGVLALTPSKKVDDVAQASKPKAVTSAELLNFIKAADAKVPPVTVKSDDILKFVKAGTSKPKATTSDEVLKFIQSNNAAHPTPVTSEDILNFIQKSSTDPNPKPVTSEAILNFIKDSNKATPEAATGDDILKYIRTADAERQGFRDANAKVLSDSGIPRADHIADSIEQELKRINDDVTEGAETVFLDSHVKLPLNGTMKAPQVFPDWFKESKLGGGIAKTTGEIAAKISSGTRMLQYTGGDLNHPASRLLATATTQGDNAVYAAASVKSNLDHRLMSLQDEIKEVTVKHYNTNPVIGYKEHALKMQEVQGELQMAMLRLDDAVVKYHAAHGTVPDAKQLDELISTAETADHIKQLQRTYIKSGFAEEAHTYIAHAQLMDTDVMAKIVKRPTYTPVRHAYQRMRDLIKTGKVEADELYVFIGKQIQRMYPEVLAGARKFNLSPKQLGKNFYDQQAATSKNANGMSTGGISKEDMTVLLQRAGAPEKESLQYADSIFGTEGRAVGSGEAKHLRARLNWDWDQGFKGVDGNKYYMADLIDQDMFRTLSDYSRTMSARVGLARYGVKSPNQLKSIMDDLVENKPANVSTAEAEQFTRGVTSQLLGQPVGEPLPAIVRSAQTMGSSLVLAGSGLWTVNDLVTQTYRVGLLRTLPHMIKAMKPVLMGLKGITKTDANNLSDILTGRLGTSGAWQHIITRTDDAFDVSKGVHQTIEHAGQSTRFANGSEFVRRYQIGLLTGIFESAFKGASKGSARDIKYLKGTFKFSDELVEGVSKEYKLHGGNIDSWSNDVRIAMEQKVGYEVDNLAHTIRSGEAPAFMEHSSAGKIMFPFMSYSFAMQEKMLKNSYHRDGGTAVAMIAAVQFPTAMLLGAVSNVKNGKEWDEDLAAASINAFSIMGAASYPIGMILSGYGSGGSSAMIPFDSTMRLGSKMFGESEVTARDVIKATPLNTMLPIPLILSAFEE